MNYCAKVRKNFDKTKKKTSLKVKSSLLQITFYDIMKNT